MLGSESHLQAIHLTSNCPVFSHKNWNSTRHTGHQTAWTNSSCLYRNPDPEMHLNRWEVKKHKQTGEINREIKHSWAPGNSERVFGAQFRLGPASSVHADKSFWEKQMNSYLINSTLIIPNSFCFSKALSGRGIDKFLLCKGRGRSDWL